jgi:AcrR family transcriptional regulator
METKEKILLGMLDLIAETGLEKASIGRLCKKIKVSPGNVYFYFASKVELLNTLYHYCISKLMDSLGLEEYSDISEEADCFEYTSLMVNLVKNVIIFYKQNPNMLNFVITSKSSCYLSDEIKRGRFKGTSFFDSFWLKSKQKGIIKDVSTEFIIAYILGVIYEFMKEDIIFNNLSLDDGKVDILNDLIWSGLLIENRIMS